MIDLLSAVTDITPADPLPLAGYADLTYCSHDTHSPLEANVVQLGNGETEFIFVGVDTLFIGTSLKQGLLDYLSRHDLRINSSQLHLFSSHTHTAPSLDSDQPQLGSFSQAYLDQCINSIGEAVLKARWRLSAMKMSNRLTGVSLQRMRVSNSSGCILRQIYPNL